MNGRDEILIQETREQLLAMGSTEDEVEAILESMADFGMFDIKDN